MGRDDGTVVRAYLSSEGKDPTGCREACRGLLHPLPDKGSAPVLRRTTCSRPEAAPGASRVWGSSTIVWWKQNRSMLQLVRANLVMRLRILISAAIGVASGAFCWF